MRIPIIAGNWKMNKGAAEAASFVSELARAAGETRAETVVCPPFTSIPAAIAAARETSGPSLNPQPSTLNPRATVRVGAQDLIWKESGDYTGKVAPGMLTELGVTHVIIGHSERRGRFGVPEEGFTPEVLALFGESDATVNLKTHAALKHGLVPIVCCGETLAERRAGDTDRVVQGQIERG